MVSGGKGPYREGDIMAGGKLVTPMQVSIANSAYANGHAAARRECAEELAGYLETVPYGDDPGLCVRIAKWRRTP